MNRLRAILVDDERLAIKQMRKLLDEQPGISVVGTAGDAQRRTVETEAGHLRAVVDGGEVGFPLAHHRRQPQRALAGLGADLPGAGHAGHALPAHRGDHGHDHQRDQHLDQREAATRPVQNRPSTVDSVASTWPSSLRTTASTRWKLGLGVAWVRSTPA